MNHTIIHFEIPANDPEKLAGFYRSLFNWKIEKFPGPMEYWSLETAPEGEGVNGGMMRRQMPSQTPTNYFNSAQAGSAGHGFLRCLPGPGRELLRRLGGEGQVADPAGRPMPNPDFKASR